MTRQTVTFNDFLSGAKLIHQPEQMCDVSVQVKHESLNQCYQINPCYGEGWVKINPLMAGSCLVTMSFTPSQDIEIFERDIQHSGLGITFCLEGQVECIADNTKLLVAQHQSCFQRYQNTCSYAASCFKQGLNHKYLTIHLSHDWLTECGRSLGLAIVNDDYWSGIYNLGKSSDQKNALLGVIYQSINDDKYSHHQLSAKALELWSLLIAKLEKLEQFNLKVHSLKKAEDVARIMQAEQIIRESYQSPPNLLSLARYIGINDHKLKCGFKEMYNETVFSYLRKIRLEKARELLAQKYCSIARVSEDVGYSSSSHFAVAFKKQYGLSPRDYQKQLLTINNSKSSDDRNSFSV